MTEFDERVELITNRLDKAVQANMAMYQLDFENKKPEADKALRLLGDSIVAYGLNRIDETQVKPNFLAWVRAIKI